LDGGFVPLNASRESLQFAQIRAVDLLSPPLQSMSLSLVNHHHQILHELIRLLESAARLAKSRQSLSLHLIQALRITRHPSQRADALSILLNTLGVGCCLDLGVFEGLQVPIDGPL
jgi:hypothetical protein